MHSHDCFAPSLVHCPRLLLDTRRMIQPSRLDGALGSPQAGTKRPTLAPLYSTMRARTVIRLFTLNVLLLSCQVPKEYTYRLLSLDQQHLAALAIDAATNQISEAASNALTNQALLKQVFCQTQDPIVRRIVAAKMDGPSLASVAMHAPDSSLNLEAIRFLSE